MTAREPTYVYSDGPHPIGTVERVGDRWRASTRHTLLGIEFPDRKSAVEAVHETLDRGGDR